MIELNINYFYQEIGLRKPLYYFESSNGFYFASEIKALKELSGFEFTITNKKLYSYLVNGHKSIYKS